MFPKYYEEDIYNTLYNKLKAGEKLSDEEKEYLLDYNDWEHPILLAY